MSNQKVILVECVLIRARKNLPTSLDKGLGRGKQAGTFEGGRRKDILEKKKDEDNIRQRWPERMIVLGILIKYLGLLLWL